MNEDKPQLDIQKLPIKQKALAILIDNGLSTKEAGKALSYKGNSVFDAKTKLNKHRLTDSNLGVSSKRAVRDTLLMKPVNTVEYKQCPACKNVESKAKTCTICNGVGALQTVIYPNVSDRLKAAEMYYSRIDPVVQQVHTTSETLVAVINLNEVQ